LSPYRFREHLERTAYAAIPALETAASLLIVDSAVESIPFVGKSERLQGIPPRNQWSQWLTNLFDQQICSHWLPTRDNEPPVTTRKQWRTAALAFGRVVFSDKTFGALQKMMGQSADLVETHSYLVGQVVRNSPPTCVRGLLAIIDPSALPRHALESPTLGLPNAAPSIETNTEPTSFRRELDELWNAANYLRIARAKSTGMFSGVNEQGRRPSRVSIE
jgi:hypothetical protein